MQRSITLYNDPILRSKGAKIDMFDDELKALSNDMIETMYAANGIGLAGQQVGISKQICVIDVRPNKEMNIEFDYSFDEKIIPIEILMPLTIINPEILIKDKTPTIYDEGCLSFPGINGRVSRITSLSCRFQDTSGAFHSLEANGLLARCILHEIDHLNGILFIDLMDKKDLKHNALSIKKLKSLK